MRILKATYGSGDCALDVTERLQRLVQNGRLSITVSNSLFTDPCPYKIKTLHFAYVLPGSERFYTRRTQEHELAVAPLFGGIRILVTNQYMQAFCGSETYTRAAAAELTRRGHDVTMGTFFPGQVSQGFHTPPPDEIAALPAKHFELALVNHNPWLDRIVRSQVAKRVIFTMHGTVPGLEQPVPGADVYVAISEEVAEHAARLGYQTTVIRNGIDLERFAPRNPLSERLQRVLLLSNYHGARETVAQACQHAGCAFRHIGHGGEAVTNPEQVINEADLIVTIGRGALESMACNRNVVVFDHRDYLGEPLGDGFFTPEDGALVRRTNYSGRARRIAFTPETLAEEFARYDPTLDLRGYIRKHHDIRTIIDQYLAL